VDISRKAELYETSSGLVTITGGKLTTWRRMAKMAVDRIVDREGREAPCRTEEIPLGMPIDPAELPGEHVDGEVREHLAARYGFAARDVLELVAADPELGRRISPELPDIVAEAAFAVRREQARSVGDALLRRTRLGLLDARRLSDAASEGAELVAQAMGAELGWDDARRRTELERWQEEARAEGLVPVGERRAHPAEPGASPREAA
jgi:glycerol-3-phosphate dehydrogenase